MRYLLEFTPQSLKDVVLLKRESTKLAGKLLMLMTATMEHPFEGLGKPEALKGDLVGYWSRRIDQKHRFIYKVKEDRIVVISCYGHYDDK